MPRPLIYLVAGEESGDILGARLITALREHGPVEFAGIGGARMERAGLASLFPMRELAVMGLVEVLPRLNRLRRRLDETIAHIEATRPSVIVTIDSPGFALRVLRRVAPLGVPRIHYVAPQVWGWREGRVRRYPGLWDDLLCLLPFEPDFFRRHGVPARFVGHPVLESGADRGDGTRFRARHGLAPDAPLLIVLPGSRRTEIARLLPVFAAAAARLHAAIPGLRLAIPLAGAVAAEVAGSAPLWPTPPVFIDTESAKYDAYATARAALVKSGTSSLELAVAGVPMVVGYRVNPVTAAIVRRLVRVRYASIVNLLADAPLIPEFIQRDCAPDRLADALVPLLLSDQAEAAQRATLASPLAALRPPEGTPSEAAARAVLERLRP